MPNFCRRVPLLAAVLVVIAVVALGAEGGVAFDLDAVFGTDAFSSTLPSDLQWFPDGSAFVFRHQRDGVDGLWRHDVTTGAETLIVDWTAMERRLEEARPAWPAPAMDDVNTHPTFGLGPVMSPDGSALVGVAEGDLFELDLSDGSDRFLTDVQGTERFPTFSPDGGRLAFVRDGDLFVLDLGDGAETRLTDRQGRDTLLNGRADWVYEEELDVKRAFWWSPDGRALAFLQFDTAAIPPAPIVDGMTVVPTLELQRYPKAGGANSTVRLGVVPVAGGEVRWLDVAVGGGYLARAGWLPGGSAVWVQVLDRSQKRLELKVVDVATGNVRTVLADTDPAWVNVGDELTFLDDETFVWASERDGYRHLYLIGGDGAVRRQLTSGTWQVTEVYGVDRKRRRVLFQGNRGDPSDRHLFAVRYLESRPWVDSSRIGVYGGSYGGFMTLTLMTRAGEHFAAGIAYAPVTDWRLYDSVYTERYMGTPATNPDGYRNSAPVTHAADLHGDLLICHGAMDNNVHTQNTLQFAGAAMVAGHDVQLMLFPRVRHGIRVSRLKLPFHRLKADFLQRHLIGGEASPECGPEASNPCRSRASGPTGGGYS